MDKSTSALPGIPPKVDFIGNPFGSMSGEEQAAVRVP
jgi:hypothetical protein